MLLSLIFHHHHCINLYKRWKRRKDVFSIMTHIVKTYFAAKTNTGSNRLAHAVFWMHEPVSALHIYAVMFLAQSVLSSHSCGDHFNNKSPTSEYVIRWRNWIGWRSFAHMADITDITPTAAWLIHESEVAKLKICVFSRKLVDVFGQNLHWLSMLGEWLAVRLWPYLKQAHDVCMVCQVWLFRA